MEYEIVKVGEDGRGYATITLPNGDTFGQWFCAPSVTDETAFFREVEEQLTEAVERFTPKPTRVIDARILSQVGRVRQAVVTPGEGRVRG